MGLNGLEYPVDTATLELGRAVTLSVKNSCLSVPEFNARPLLGSERTAPPKPAITVVSGLSKEVGMRMTRSGRFHEAGAASGGPAWIK